MPNTKVGSLVTADKLGNLCATKFQTFTLSLEKAIKETKMGSVTFR